MEGYRRFLALLVSALLLGFVAVVCSLVWVFRYREGLGWDGGAAEFNWHPVLVVTGFVFIQGIDCTHPARKHVQHIWTFIPVERGVWIACVLALLQELSQSEAGRCRRNGWLPTSGYVGNLVI